MSLDHLSHQIQEQVHGIRRVGKVRKYPTPSDDEIAEEIEQNSLRPERVLALPPVRCDGPKSTGIRVLHDSFPNVSPPLLIE